MKKLLAFFLFVLIGTALLAAPFYKIKVDPQNRPQQWSAYAFKGDTMTLRAYLYIDGEQWQPAAGWGGRLAAGTNYQFSTVLMTITGTVNSATNFIEFGFTTNQTAYDTLFCEIQMTNATQRITMQQGLIHLQTSIFD